MKFKNSKLAALAVTMITLGSLAGATNAALSITISANPSGKAVITWEGVNFTTSGLTVVPQPDDGGNSDNFILSSPKYFTLINLSYNWRSSGASFAIPSFSSGLSYSGISTATTGVGGNGIRIDESGRISTNNSYTGATDFLVSNTYDTSIVGLGIAPNFSFSTTWSNGQTFSFKNNAVPEVSSTLLLGFGALGLVARRRRN